MKKSLYARRPLETRNDIPCFSRADEYTENYEQISTRHLAAVNQGIANPFYEDEDIWIETEESTASLIRRYSRPGQRVLDAGVGMGRLLALFPDLDRYGMDISWGYLEQARNKGIQVCYSRIEDMPYNEEFFDMVTCTDVLEHVFDLNLALRKLLHVLKPGGVLIVRVPYREYLGHYVEPEYPYRFAHLRNFDEFSLELLLNRVFNCEVLEYALAAFITGYERFRHFVPLARYVNFALRNLLKPVKRISSKMHRGIMAFFYLPYVITIAVRKAESVSRS